MSDAIVGTAHTPSDSMEAFSVVPKAGLAGIGPHAGAQQTVMFFLFYLHHCLENLIKPKYFFPIELQCRCTSCFTVTVPEQFGLFVTHAAFGRFDALGATKAEGGVKRKVFG